MKRKLLNIAWCVALLGALTGCSESSSSTDGEETKHEIRIASVAVRSTYVDLQEISQNFGGWCFKTPDADANANRQIVMDNVKVYYDQTLRGWDYANHRFWDERADYEFYGYAPWNADVVTYVNELDEVKTAKGNPVKRIKIQNIVMGDATGDNKAVDWLLARDVLNLRRPSDFTIHLSFDHLLAHVIFCLYSEDEGVVLKSADFLQTVGGRPLVSSANFTEGKERVAYKYNPEETWNSEWEPTETKTENTKLAPLTITGGAVPGPPAEGKKQDYLVFANMLMIPQYITPSLTLQLQLDNGGGLKEVPITTQGYDDVGGAAKFFVESGKEYVFYLKITGDGLKLMNVLQIDNFTADENLWEEEK